MKKLLLILIIGFSSCWEKYKPAHLIPTQPLIVIDKFIGANRYSNHYYLLFYQEGSLYKVETDETTYRTTSVKDTIHGYNLIPQ